MTSKNNNNDNVIQMNLTSWCRWKALYYKDMGSLSTTVKEESVYIGSLPVYKQRWIVNGEGSMLAPITNDVIKAALEVMIDESGVDKTIKLIMTSCNDFKFYADYCFDLQYNK
jgi:hypothetical protein